MLNGGVARNEVVVNFVILCHNSGIHMVIITFVCVNIIMIIKKCIWRIFKLQLRIKKYLCDWPISFFTFYFNQYQSLYYTARNLFPNNWACKSFWSKKQLGIQEMNLSNKVNVAVYNDEYSSLYEICNNTIYVISNYYRSYLHILV